MQHKMAAGRYRSRATLAAVACSLSIIIITTTCFTRFAFCSTANNQLATTSLSSPVSNDEQRTTSHHDIPSPPECTTEEIVREEDIRSEKDGVKQLPEDDESHHSTATTGAADEVQQATPACNQTSEFHCELEQRCIPLEMRCDFIEQCLDGRDELGCPPESCNFKNSRCYWLNEPLIGPPKQRQRLGGKLELELELELEPLARNDLWRRYSVGGDGPDDEQHEPAKRGLPALMQRLSTGLSAGEKFLFVAMPSALTAPHQDNKFLSSEPSASLRPGGSARTPATTSAGDTHERRPRVVTLVRRTQLQTPQIGRTSAMCQLRFEYALWPRPPEAVKGDEASLFATTLSNGGKRATRTRLQQTKDGKRARVARIETTLRLVARSDKLEQRRRLQQQTNSDLTSTVAQAANQASGITLWSRRVDWPASGAGVPSLASANAHIDYQSHLVSGGDARACQPPDTRHCAEVPLNWTVGVAELGHLELFRLSFEVESRVRVLVETPRAGGGSGEGRSRASVAAASALESPQDASHHVVPLAATLAPGMTQASLESNLAASSRAVKHLGAAEPLLPFEGSLVALKWLKFHGCHAWPRGAGGEGASCTLNLNFMDQDEEEEFIDEEEQQQLDEEEQEEEDLSDEQSEDSDTESAEPTLRRRQAAGEPQVAPECDPGEFKCRNNFCLSQDRLCNFVDECMSSSNWSVCGANNLHPYGTRLSSASGEDEALDLCGAILGREDFESARPDEKQMQLFLTSRPDRFWHLAGNWTMSKVGVRSTSNAYNQQQQQQKQQQQQDARHLPRVDHTTRTDRGSYLSLELPLGRDSAQKNFERSDSMAASQHAASEHASELYWVAIKSQWMRRPGKSVLGECRLKFFYNLVSSSPQLMSAASGIELALAVEHYTLRNATNNTDYDGRSSPGHAHSLEHTLDHLLHSNKQLDGTRIVAAHATGSGSSGVSGHLWSAVEYPGVDFWREFNLELGRAGNLKEGDLFMVRLVIYAEISADARRRVRATGERVTINLDDMATHFGCGPLEDTRARAHLNELSERHWLARGAFHVADYLAPAHLQQKHEEEVKPAESSFPPRLRHKWDWFWPRGREEASGRLRWQLSRSNSELGRSKSGDDDDPTQDGGMAALEMNAGGQSQIEPQKLVACVLGAFCLIMGLIALIVFVLVPHVERAMMSYQDAIQLNLSGDYSDLPNSQSATTNFLVRSSLGSVSEPSSPGSSPASGRSPFSSATSTSTLLGGGNLGSPVGQRRPAATALAARGILESSHKNNPAGFTTFDWDVPATFTLDMPTRRRNHSLSGGAPGTTTKTTTTWRTARPSSSSRAPDGGAGGRDLEGGCVESRGSARKESAESCNDELSWLQQTTSTSSEEEFQDASDK